MSSLLNLNVHTVRYIPHTVRPLLASVLSKDLSFSMQHKLWKFIRLLLFPKLVLCSPPRVGKKHYLIGSLLCDRLNKWKSGVDGILDLWQAAGALQRGSSARSVTTSAESLEKGNIRRALRWVSDGCYGNALRALGSRGVASYDNVAAWDD